MSACSAVYIYVYVSLVLNNFDVSSTKVKPSRANGDVFHLTEIMVVLRRSHHTLLGSR